MVEVVATVVVVVVGLTIDRPHLFLDSRLGYVSEKETHAHT